MTIQSDALTEAKVGDEITVWVNENNVVIDAYPKGAARSHHRWVRGNLSYTSGNQEAITLWTPEGKKDFIVKQNRSKFGSFAEGSPITVVSQMFKIGPVAMHLECGAKGQDARLSLVYSATVFSELIRTVE